MQHALSRAPLFAVLAALTLPGLQARAADADDAVRRIRITTTGVDRTTPDIARISFTARGEGQSADEATAAASNALKAIEGALGQVRGARHNITVGDVTMAQVRDKACNESTYPPRPQLSTGACAIVGRVAELRATLRLSPATSAGTAAGVIARAGGLDATVETFELSNPAEARKRALASALAQAKEEAEALAQASGVQLGKVLAINNDSNRAGDEIVVTAHRAVAPPPPPPPPPPVEIGMTPSQITTNAMVTVFYAIAE
jgi:uncharacterized protein YggE